MTTDTTQWETPEHALLLRKALSAIREARVVYVMAEVAPGQFRRIRVNKSDARAMVSTVSAHSVASAHIFALKDPATQDLYLGRPHR